MGLARYFVIRQADHWLVTLEGRAMAHVATKTEAINSAIVMADLMGTMQHDADVMLEDGEKLSLIWTYGKNKVRGGNARKLPRAPRATSRSHVRAVSLPA